MSEPIKQRQETIEPTTRGFFTRHPITRELIIDQAPMVIGVFLVGLVVCYWQYGFVPGADRAFPVAGVRVPLWHLLWMGFWTGYAMALVGQASGIFSLSYSISILQYTAISVSPTSLVTTFLNPFGALLGFWRNRQWNLDLALWLGIGAVLGAPLGPFLRVYVLSDPVPFKAFIGLVLIIMAIQLIIEITPWYLRRTTRQRAFKEQFDKTAHAERSAGRLPSGLPADFRIVTLERSWKQVTIGYLDQRVSLRVPTMLITGWIIGVIGAALGIGGGFLLVPILVIGYGLPMYVVVAASIPFVIVLSLVGLAAYLFTLPWLTGKTVAPDWAFGLFVASGAIFGAWLAAKTQKYIPENYLKPMLGVITGLAGLLYVINYFWTLPFKV